MEQNIRTFIAIELPEEIKKEIQKISKNFEGEFIGKFTDPEKLHLTLKFLGEISEEQVEEVKKRFENFKFKKFEAVLDSVGVFSPKFVKILWAHISGEEMIELQKEIDDKLKDLFPMEERFMSHVTIARVKQLKDKIGFLKKLKKIKFEKKRFPVDRFFIKKSTLSEKGPVYEDLMEIQLK
jgi:2'-5' RNA ligase